MAKRSMASAVVSPKSKKEKPGKYVAKDKPSGSGRMMSVVLTGRRSP